VRNTKTCKHCGKRKATSDFRRNSRTRWRPTTRAAGWCRRPRPRTGGNASFPRCDPLIHPDWSTHEIDGTPIIEHEGPVEAAPRLFPQEHPDAEGRPALHFSLTKDGLSSWCSACHVESTRRWRAENPDSTGGGSKVRRVSKRPPAVTTNTPAAGRTHPQGRPQR
jgi:hypothetical protein